jgi:hypothetical protein
LAFLITAVLLSGCSNNSADSSTSINKSPEIKLAITQACSGMKFVSITGVILMNLSVASKFNEIAKLDSSYNGVATDAFKILQILDTWKRGIDSNQVLQAEQILASARLNQFCAINS